MRFPEERCGNTSGGLGGPIATNLTYTHNQYKRNYQCES